MVILETIKIVKKTGIVLMKTIHILSQTVVSLYNFWPYRQMTFDFGSISKIKSS